MESTISPIPESIKNVPVKSIMPHLIMRLSYVKDYRLQFYFPEGLFKYICDPMVLIYSWVSLSEHNLMVWNYFLFSVISALLEEFFKYFWNYGQRRDWYECRWMAVILLWNFEKTVNYKFFINAFLFAFSNFQLIWFFDRYYTEIWKAVQQCRLALN